MKCSSDVTEHFMCKSSTSREVAYSREKKKSRGVRSRYSGNNSMGLVLHQQVVMAFHFPLDLVDSCTLLVECVLEENLNKKSW